ncbi:hypothetical protein FOXYSP1_07300 [Fusarium oxysporum f. sp. phaseoli]
MFLALCPYFSQFSAALLAPTPLAHCGRGWGIMQLYNTVGRGPVLNRNVMGRWETMQTTLTRPPSQGSSSNVLIFLSIREIAVPGYNFPAVTRSLILPSFFIHRDTTLKKTRTKMARAHVGAS